MSYGLRSDVGAPGRVATVPAGYADGVPRNLGLAGGEVLVGGRRRPIVGVVTMDQLLVDLGDVAAVTDDEVVLIGRQGDEEITATEWGERLGTISYEIVTGIGARVPAHLEVAAGDAVEAWPDGSPRNRPRWRGLKRTGLVAGAAAGAVGLAYATERALVAAHPPPRRSRRRVAAGAPSSTRCASSTRHDGGTLYTISRGAGPDDRFCHGVTLSSRVWAKQFEAFPAAGFRAVAFDSRGHGESVAGRPATRSTTWPTTCAPSSRGSTSTTRSWSATRWVGWPCRRSPFAIPTCCTPAYAGSSSSRRRRTTW